MGRVVGVRLPEDLIQRIVDHAEANTLNRSQAMRRLMEKGLSALEGERGRR